MPPARSRAAHDDSKNDHTNGKERGGTSGGGKGKKSAAAANSTNSKDSAAATTSDASATQIAGVGAGLPPSLSSIQLTHLFAQMSWNTEQDLPLLQRYRSAHRLDTSSAFRSAENAAILSAPGIGRYSPTMIRKGQKKKQVPQDQLALAVRKHFNGQAVSEQEVMIDFLYSVKNQGKSTAGRVYTA